MHHWFVDIIEHITSPLTSSLTIFGTYKASHVPKMQVWLRAKRILLTAPRTAAAPFSSSAAISEPTRATASPTPSTDARRMNSHRHYSMLAMRNVVVPHRHSSVRHFSSMGTSPTLSAAGAMAAATTTSLPSAAAAPTAIAHSTEIATSWLSAISTTSPITGSEVLWSVNQFQQLINYCHVTFGISWWASILTTTLMFRFVVLPLNVSLVRNTARLYLIRRDIHRLGDIMNKGDDAHKQQAARDLLTLFKTSRAHPLKNIASPILFPTVFLSLFGAVHDLCTHHPEMKTDGLLWFTDLSAVDPTGLLPVLSALSWLATIELASGAVFHMPPWMHLTTRILAVAFIPVTQTLPSGIFIFWLTSNVFAAVRAWILRFPKVQRFAGIPSIQRPSP